MDQIKIGAFLRDLRKEHDLSQEQLAERFNVSSRSVSRWENGNTMPDISIMIELADYYDIDIRDLLRGERKSDKMEENLKETLVMVADYTEADKAKILNKVYVCGQGALIIDALVLHQPFYRLPIILNAVPSDTGMRDLRDQHNARGTAAQGQHEQGEE